MLVHPWFQKEWLETKSPAVRTMPHTDWRHKDLPHKDFLSRDSEDWDYSHRGSEGKDSQHRDL